MESQQIPSKKGCDLRASYPFPSPAEPVPSRSLGSCIKILSIKSFATSGNPSGYRKSSAGWFNICWNVRYSFSARKIGLPTSIWKIIQAKAHKSHPLEASWSRSTSGETNSAVPQNVLCLCSSVSSCQQIRQYRNSTLQVWMHLCCSKISYLDMSVFTTNSS